MAMRPCEKCNHNDWMFGSAREFPEGEIFYYKFVTAKCKQCKHKIQFGRREIPFEKPNGKIRFSTKAEYEIRDGKHFLKIEGIFKEVRLCTVNKKGQVDAFGDFLRVMPI